MIHLSILVKYYFVKCINFGEITYCKLQFNYSGNTKRFAFVNFVQKDDAEKAIKEKYEKLIEKLVYLCKFISSDKWIKLTNCYVNNFHKELNDETLKVLFEKFGEINNGKVMLDEDGVSKGVGFVSYKKCECATKAVAEMNGYMIQDRRLYVGRA